MLKDRLRPKTFRATICGQEIVSRDEASTFLGFLDFERRRYIRSDVEPESRVIMDVKGHWVLEVTVTVQSLMNFTMIETFCIALGTVVHKNVLYWKFKTIDFDGACLHSQDFDKSFVIDTWQTQRNPGNVTVEQFVEIVNNMIPFNNESDEEHFDESFVALIDTNPNINDTYDSEEFKSYMKRLMKRYKHRTDLKALPNSSAMEEKENEAITNIITQQPDHVVFLTSTIFQSIKDKQLLELWEFQIEAVLNLENQWKISKIFLRPPMYYIGNDKMFNDLLTDYVKDIRVRTEISMKNGTFPIFYNVSSQTNSVLCRYFGRNLTYDGFAKIFKESVDSHVVNVERCDHHIFEDRMEIDFYVICFHKQNKTMHRIRTDYRATYNHKKEEFNVFGMSVLCRPYL